MRDESRLGLALEDVDAVIHLAAAFRRVRDEEAVAVNEDATPALGRAAVAEGIGRFVFASTVEHAAGIGLCRSTAPAAKG